MIWTEKGRCLWAVFWRARRDDLLPVAILDKLDAVSAIEEMGYRLHAATAELVARPLRLEEAFRAIGAPCYLEPSLMAWLANVACGQAMEIERLRAEVQSLKNYADKLEGRTP